MKSLPLIVALLAVGVASCGIDLPDTSTGPGRLDVSPGDKFEYDVRVEGTLQTNEIDSATGAPAIHRSLISGPIDLSVDTTSAERIRWYYDTPQMVASVSGMSPQRVPTKPALFTTDRRGRTVDVDGVRIPVRLNGIGGMVHYNAQQLFLPDMVRDHLKGDTWAVDEVDSNSGAMAPMVNRITRTFSYRGTVDTLGKEMAVMDVKMTIRSAPRDDESERSSPTPVPQSTITNDSRLYYSLDDRLLYLLVGNALVTFDNVQGRPSQRMHITMLRQTTQKSTAGTGK